MSLIALKSSRSISSSPAVCPVRAQRASQALPAFPYAEYARSLGLKGIRVDDPAKLASAWDEALHADRPTMVEVVTDPNVPPLPPHMTMKEGKAYAKALLHHDPEGIQTVIASAKEWWDGIFAGNRDKS